jgi:uncharacterized membrane protein
VSVRARIGSTAACVAVFLGSWSLLHHVWYLRGAAIGDTTIYLNYAHDTVSGRMPYRDFSIEYPPGFLLPALAPEATKPHGTDAYVHSFDRWMAGAGVVMLLCAAVALSALRARRREFAAALGLMAVSPLLLGSVMLTHYDLWVTALAIGGLSALLVGRDRTGGVLLGAAIATKVWPAVLVPLGLIWIWRRRDRAAAVRWLVLLGAVCAAFFVPFAALAPGGLGHSFGLQIDRPLQIESLGSAVLLAAHNVGGLGASVSTLYGSQNLVAHGANAVSIACVLLQLLGLCGVWVAFARGPARADRLAAAAAASVTVFIVFGKVFSPQYLIWLIPFVPLVRSRLASLLLAVALLATQFYFPAHYPSLWRLEPWAAWLVLARDLVVVMLAVELGRVLLEREPHEDAAREPAPAAAAHEALPALQS